MKVFVTGSAGFIGQHLIHQLVEHGHSVVASHRRGSVPQALSRIQNQYPRQLSFSTDHLDFSRSLPNLKSDLMRAWRKDARLGLASFALDYEIDNADLESAKQMIADCDAVIHAAAYAGDWGSFEKFFVANVHPLRVLAQAALEKRVKAFVFVSSVAVHGFGQHNNSSEAGPYYPANNPYPLSKRLAESLLARLASQGLRAVTVRPAMVYGPGDTTTFYNLFDALQKGIMGTLSHGAFLTCPVHVDDLCNGIVACLKWTANDTQHKYQAFNLSGTGSHTWRSLLDQMSGALDLTPSKINLNGKLAFLSACVLEFFFSLVRSKAAPPLTRYRVDQLCSNYQFSHQKANEHFAYSPQVDLKDGLIACVEAWRLSKDSNQDCGPSSREVVKTP